MKRLIKYSAILLIICIFAFSSNKHVVLVRSKVKSGYELLISKMKTSDSDTVKKIGKTIE